MISQEVQKVNEGVRPEFEYNVSFIEDFLRGFGVDMGCGSCPLLHPTCKVYVDISPQPICLEQISSRATFVQADATLFNEGQISMDYVFSSHMVEDLKDSESIIQCLNNWSQLIEPGGHLILLLPDMQGGRYSTVEEGGNPSHRVNVGKEFIQEISPNLPMLKLVQIDTIPHDKSSTIDVVFQRIG